MATISMAGISNSTTTKYKSWIKIILKVAYRCITCNLIVLATLYPVHAANFHCSSGDVRCLIEAIKNANENDEENVITLDASTYTLPAEENENTLLFTLNGRNGLPSIASANRLTIQGASDGTTVIERAQNASAFRLLHVGALGDVTLSGVTIQNGVAARLDGFRQERFGFAAVLPVPGDYDGDGQADLAVYYPRTAAGIQAGTWQIARSGASRSDEGGGIFNLGRLAINSSIIRQNRSDRDGAGIRNDGMLTLTDSVVRDNTAGEDGGGIENDNNGVADIANSTIRDNTAQDDGGGIDNDGDLMLIDSTIDGNRTMSGDGGGIRNDADPDADTPVRGQMTVLNSTVSGNEAGDDGGGIKNNGVLTLINSTIGQNHAPNSNGGGIDNGNNNSPGALEISSSTVSNNNADDGGGMRNANGSIMMQNTIVAANVKGTGRRDQGPDCLGEIISLGHNLIGDTSDCTITGGNRDVTGQDPQLGEFVDDDTPGKGHYPLRPGSPAIDSGRPEEEGGCTAPDGMPLSMDQLGNPRPVDGDSDRTAVCDIGAIEQR